MFAVTSVMCCRKGGTDLWLFCVVELVDVVASVESWDEYVVLVFCIGLFEFFVISSGQWAVV